MILCFTIITSSRLLVTGPFCKVAISKCCSLQGPGFISRTPCTQPLQFSSEHARYHKYASQCLANSAKPATPKPYVSGISLALVLSAVLTSAPTFLAMVVTSPILILDRRRRTVHSWILRQWIRITLFLSRVRVRIEGSHHMTPGTLVIANRQSPLDVIALATLPTAPRFIMPARALTVPVLGWILRFGGCIPLRGGDRRAASDALDAAGVMLRSNASVILFPEAKPGPAGTVGRFLSAPFKAAPDGGPIVPVSIHGGWQMCKGAVVPAHRSTVFIVVHPPLKPASSDKQRTTDAFDAVNSGLPPEFQSR